MIEIARYIVSGLLLALVQTFILQEVNIAWWIKPMPYILLFLNIPVSVNKFGMLIRGLPEDSLLFLGATG